MHLVFPPRWARLAASVLVFNLGLVTPGRSQEGAPVAVPPALQDGKQQPASLSKPVASHERVIVRGVHADLPPSLVTLIATSAEPQRLDARLVADDGQISAGDIVKQLCGSDPGEAYYRRLDKENEDKDLGVRSFSATTPLAGIASEIDWPACLYVFKGPIDYVVRPGESASKIYARMTGVAGVNNYDDFFAGSQALAEGRLSHIDRDETLKIGWYTLAVPLTLRVSRAQFTAAVEAEQRDDRNRHNSSDRLSIQILPADRLDGGQIEVAAGDFTNEGTSDEDYISPAVCNGEITPPFDAERVADVFGWAKSQGSGAPHSVHAFIVDNGFFGAARQPDGSLKFGTGFDAPKLFRTGWKDGGEIGPPMEATDTDKIYPLNTINLPSATPGIINGHGTHVLGLMLGGEGFSNQAGLLSPWLKVTVIAVSKGAREMPTIPVRGVSRWVSSEAPGIVNFSASFSRKNQVELEELVRTNPRTLFVVAAGNGDPGVEIETKHRYPAGLGDEPNVLTVAGLDSAGQVGSYSNRSGSNWSFRTVGLAAPGCDIRSWIDANGSLRALSGTSQAAPLVSFAAILLSAVMKTDPPGEAVKTRLLISGDLISANTPVLTRSRLNIEKALYVQDDYLDFKAVDPLAPPPAPGEKPQLVAFRGLGTLSPNAAPVCGQGLTVDDLLALKSRPGAGKAKRFVLGFTGQRPMAVVVCNNANKQLVDFVMRARVTDKGVQMLPAPVAFYQVPLGQVSELIRRGPGEENS
jgi:Subtilase family